MDMEDGKSKRFVRKWLEKHQFEIQVGQKIIKRLGTLKIAFLYILSFLSIPLFNLIVIVLMFNHLPGFD